jgi:hypothetical protein
VIKQTKKEEKEAKKNERVIENKIPKLIND